MAIDHVIPTFAALSSVIVVLPISWHIKAHNWPVLFLAFWLFVWNLIIFVNGVTWWQNLDNPSPIWCDISVKLTSAYQMAVPCSNLCIARRLESIASTRTVSSTARDRKIALVVDLALVAGLPLIYTILSIVYQGHRFDIIEGIGCFPAIFASTPFLVLGILPPIIVSLLSLAYSVLALRHFIIRQRQFNAVLSSSGTHLNKSRYLRMMAFCSLDTLVYFPIAIACQAIAIPKYKASWQPYTSWEDVHYGFSYVGQAPATIFDGSEDARKLFISQTLARWVGPFSAFLFIGFFGFSSEAMKEYRAWGQRLRTIFSFRNRRVKGGSESISSQAYPQVHELPNLSRGKSDILDLESDSKAELPSPVSYYGEKGFENARQQESVNVQVERTVFSFPRQ